MWVVLIKYIGEPVRLSAPAHLFDTKEQAVTWAERRYGNTLNYLRYAQLGDMET